MKVEAMKFLVKLMQSTTFNIYVRWLQHSDDATLIHNILTGMLLPTGSQITQAGSVGSLPLCRSGFKLKSSENEL